MAKTESDETTSFSFSELNCITNPGDGHCLIHTVLTSIRFIGLNRVFTEDTLLSSHKSYGIL